MAQKAASPDDTRSGDGERFSASHRGTNLAIVGGCGIVSAIMLYCVACEYGSIRGGEVFLFSMIPVLLVSLIMTVIVAVSSRRRHRGGIALAAICLAPAVGIAGIYIAGDVSFRINGPADRFRDYVADPIPGSVSEIRFATLEQELDPNLALWFRIAKPDLERIIQEQLYHRVSPGNFLSRTDRFNDPSYLRVGNDDEFYQRVNQFGEVFTLRVNKEHTAGVFRCESSPTR